MNNYLSLSFEELNDSLFVASKQNDFEAVKYLLTSPELKVHANIHSQNNKALRIAADNNNVEMFNYLLKSPYLKEHADINVLNDFIFKRACEDGCLNIVRYILETPGLNRNVSEAASFKSGVDSAYPKGNVKVLKYLIDDFAKDYDLSHYHLARKMFDTVCTDGYLEMGKYIMSNPNLSQHIDLSFDKNVYFRTACGFDNWDVVEFLIFDLNQPKTSDLVNFIDRMEVKHVQEMFQKRELYESLHSDLTPNQSVAKKMKV